MCSSMPAILWRLRHRSAVNNSSKFLISFSFSSTKHSPLWHALTLPTLLILILLHRDLRSSFFLLPNDPMKTEAGGEESECIISSSRSRDLLLRFSGRLSSDEATEVNGSDSDEIELGLSLGGCFNSANSHKNRILRSSSISAILPSEIPQRFPLFRTCSLPEEEMHSKTRKRVEEDLEGEPVFKSRRLEIENSASSPAALRWRNPSTLMKVVAAASQDSVVLEGSNSLEGLESRSSGQGFELSRFSHASEIRSPSFSPASATPISKPLNDTSIRYDIVSNETLLRKNNGGRRTNGSGELSKSMTKEMPSVWTKGDGPNGRRIEGFLYKYGRGEEVVIICMCHASFFTPAEFVKHAGGGDVVHPLRHIVVNPKTAVFMPSFIQSTQKISKHEHLK